jgi:hypothetical protein
MRLRVWSGQIARAMMMSCCAPEPPPIVTWSNPAFQGCCFLWSAGLAQCKLLLKLLSLPGIGKLT